MHRRVHILHTSTSHVQEHAFINKRAPPRCTQPRSALRRVRRKARAWTPRCVQPRSTQREPHTSGRTTRAGPTARLEGSLRSECSVSRAQCAASAQHMRPRGTARARPRVVAHTPRALHTPLHVGVYYNHFACIHMIHSSITERFE